MIDMAWVLGCGTGVLGMQAGFVLLEAGSVRARSLSSIVFKNAVDSVVCVLAFWLFGYAVAFGDGTLVGLGGFAVESSTGTEAAAVFFQTTFAATAATIVSGAVAERSHVRGYLIFTLVVGTIIYPVAAHATWNADGVFARGNGNDGVLDFAGGLTVHGVGGAAALCAALVVGPREDFRRSAPPRGHSVMLASLGVLVLLVLWVPFNAGSTLGLSDGRAPVAARAALNTIIGAAAGALATAVELLRQARAARSRRSRTSRSLLGGPLTFDVMQLLGGIVGGLVSVTAGSGYMPAYAAALVGFVGGPICLWSASALRRACVDDPVDAISAHLVCGVWGTLAAGLFADGALDDDAVGALYGNPHQLLLQAAACAALVAWTVVASMAALYAVVRTTGIRVSPSEQERGLDSTLGGSAYPEWLALHERHARQRAEPLARLEMLLAEPVGYAGTLARAAKFLEGAFCCEMLDFLLVAREYQELAHTVLDSVASEKHPHEDGPQAYAEQQQQQQQLQPSGQQPRRVSALFQGRPGARRVLGHARAIFELYVRPGAELQVNISCAEATTVAKALEQAEAGSSIGVGVIFAGAVTQTLHMVAMDPFRRFADQEDADRAEHDASPDDFRWSDVFHPASLVRRRALKRGERGAWDCRRASESSSSATAVVPALVRPYSVSHDTWRVEWREPGEVGDG